jgi:hypothetical protein
VVQGPNQHGQTSFVIPVQTQQAQTGLQIINQKIPIVSSAGGGNLVAITSNIGQANIQHGTIVTSVSGDKQKFSINAPV